MLARRRQKAAAREAGVIQGERKDDTKDSENRSRGGRCDPRMALCTAIFHISIFPIYLVRSGHR